jgi:hypothetical protein
VFIHTYHIPPPPQPLSPYHSSQENSWIYRQRDAYLTSVRLNPTLHPSTDDRPQTLRVFTCSLNPMTSSKIFRLAHPSPVSRSHRRMAGELSRKQASASCGRARVRPEYTALRYNSLAHYRRVGGVRARFVCSPQTRSSIGLPTRRPASTPGSSSRR